MEHNLMTVKDVADYMRLSEQTIQRWVMKREIPFHKVKKVIRFRLSEIDAWVNRGGPDCAGLSESDRHGDLFADDMSGETGEAAETTGAGAEAGETEGAQI
jgi:excisionase family DNA binding protein